MTHANLVQAVRSQSLKIVPDHIKADLLRRIKVVLEGPLFLENRDQETGS